MYLKESAAGTAIVGPLIDDTDFKTAETGMAGTMTVTLVKADGTTGVRHATGTITHRSGGNYTVPLDSTDTNQVGLLRMIITNSGALQAWRDFFVLDSATYDAMVGAAVFPSDPDGSTMATHVAAMYAGFDDTNNVFYADVKRLSGDATAADNLEADYDGTGYTKSNSSTGANVTSISGSSSAADKLEAAALSYVSGAAQTGTLTTTVMTTNLSGFSDDNLNGRWLFFTSGSRAGVGQKILDYASTNGTVTFAAALPGAPANGDAFVIV